MSSAVRNFSVLGIIVLVGLGAYWVGRQQGEFSALSEKLTPATGSAETERLQRENARLMGENERLVTQRTAAEASPVQPPTPTATSSAVTAPLDRLHTLVELQQRKLVNPMLPVIDSNGKLQPNFTELFDLSSTEKDTLQQALDQAHQQVDQLATSSATLSRRPDGAAVISIPASATGTAIRDALMNTFAQTLGPERNNAFVALTQSGQTSQLDSMMNAFGAEDRTITVTRAVTARGMGQITVQDMRRSQSGSNSTFTTTIPDSSRLPDRIRWIAPLLPSDF